MTYILYHKNCMDGFGAAFACQLYADRHEDERPIYIPVQYGDEVPVLEPESQVIIVDFCYDAETLWRLANEHTSVVVIDHHKTAKSHLEDLQRTSHGWTNTVGGYENMDLLTFTRSDDAGRGISLPVRELHVRYDTSKSGCVLTWEYLFSLDGDPVPELLLYLQDRDLWTWELENSRVINDALRSYEMDFEVWKSFLDRPLDLFVVEGQAISRHKTQAIERICSYAYFDDIGGYEVPVVCASCYQSEIGEHLCTEYTEAAFSASFVETPTGRIYSLRSRGGFDVGELAKTLGGGGHAAAAGFKVEK